MAAETNGSPAVVGGGFRERFRESFRRSIRRIRGPVERDPKKVGILGAPQCRCTPLVLALCVALTGLVVVGVGACMTAFMWHDETPKALGLSLVGLGIVMMAAGVGLFIYDSKVRSLMPPRANAEVTYSTQSQSATQLPPASPLGGGQAMGTITNVHTMPAGAGHIRRPQSLQGTAPPPYDAVLQEDGRYRGGGSSQLQNFPPSNMAGSAVKRNITSSDV